MTKKVIFDIETISQDFDKMDDDSKKMLEEKFKRWAETEEEMATAKERLTFSPLTAEIVAIAMLDPDTQRGAVYFQNNGKKFEPTEEGNVKFESGDEKFVLNKFWEATRFYEEFITFAGRIFDVPMLMVRSAVNDIRPVKNLMTNRYLDNQPFNLKHIDLQDQLTFYGAKRDDLGLHFWCRAFGIPSPKVSGITGYDVTRFYKDGRCLEIAKYCFEDVRATAALYRKWNEFLRFS